MEKIKLFRNTFSTLLTIVISCLLIMGVVYATTSVGTSISTGGTLDVTGLSTFSRATTTSATTTEYLYVGYDGDEPAGWNFAGGDLFVGGAAYFGAKATATTAFAVGSGTGNNIDFAGGDLYVQDDAEIDGGLYTDSATTTDTLKVGGKITLGNGETMGNASNNNVFVDTTGMSLNTSTPTTTNMVWVGAQAGNATSSVVIGGGRAGDATANRGCIELWREDKPYRIYINAVGSGIVAEAGRCKE